jgi:hypothetical protein
LYRKRGPAERIVHAVAALAEGLGIRAVTRVLEVDPTTVQTWLSEAATQLAAFSRSLLHAVHVKHVQFDELFTLVREAKAGSGNETEATEDCPHSPAWIWAALDPVSKVLLALREARSLAASPLQTPEERRVV